MKKTNREQRHIAYCVINTLKNPFYNIFKTWKKYYCHTSRVVNIGLQYTHYWYSNETDFGSEMPINCIYTDFLAIHCHSGSDFEVLKKTPNHLWNVNKTKCLLFLFHRRKQDYLNILVAWENTLLRLGHQSTIMCCPFQLITYYFEMEVFTDIWMLCWRWLWVQLVSHLPGT